MNKAKEIFTSWRNIVVLFLLLFSFLSIKPNFDASGVAIRSVGINSSAELAGIKSPKPTEAPMNREVITSLNSKVVTDMQSFNDAVKSIVPDTTFTVKTNINSYRLEALPRYNVTVLGELEEKTVTKVINGTEVNETILVNKTVEEFIGIHDIGLKVYNAPTSNIRLGLDLQGGTRVLLQPDGEVSSDDMDILLTNMKQRLNVYGLSDVIVREAGDLSGNRYILVEIAGANEDEVKDLLAKQGKFEAKIGNETVFKGGNKDITYVCRSADCSGIDPMAGCGQVEGGYSCRFRFSISLSPSAAKAQAHATSKLNVLTTDEMGNSLPDERHYLDKKLELLLDDVLVDSLNIGADLKGNEATDIQISGSGFGANEQQAMFNSLENMKKLQTYLSTGSLPVKINIVKTDSISPVLGKKFIENAIFIGFIALLGVAFVVLIRYRKIKIALPIVFYSVSEVFILLGVASLIGWNLDLAAIAGIIIIVGTSVDHQIVITDEIIRKGTVNILTMKQKIKNALFIIMGAFFTTAVAMLPLVFAGAGLLKGFALTTMIGIFIGVFIARPAFARTLEILMKE